MLFFYYLCPKLDIHSMMTLRKMMSLLALPLLLGACGGEKKKGMGADEMIAVSKQNNQPGDNTLYGLACDGCTDSIIVMLPYEADRLDTFDIINANMHRQVFGKPKIGDRLAVIVNPEDSGEALMVVDLDVLKGSWCYKQMPKLRDISTMPKRLQRRIVSEMTDSERTALLIPREVGYQIRRENTVRTLGDDHIAKTSDDQSMVEYPRVKRYNEWAFFNGRLVLKGQLSILGDSTAMQQHEETVADTAELILLQDDSLVIRMKDGDKNFYRKR